MKKNILILTRSLTLLAVAVLFSACSDEPAPAETVEDAVEDVADAVEEAGDAVEEAADK